MKQMKKVNLVNGGKEQRSRKQILILRLRSCAKNKVVPVDWQEDNKARYHFSCTIGKGGKCFLAEEVKTDSVCQIWEGFLCTISFSSLTF